MSNIAPQASGQQLAVLLEHTAGADKTFCGGSDSSRLDLIETLAISCPANLSRMRCHTPARLKWETAAGKDGRSMSSSTQTHVGKQDDTQEDRAYIPVLDFITAVCDLEVVHPAWKDPFLF